ncbi:MAG: FadR family transcriptional regulator [Oscillospiraceae bacterium]|nr:FadR family transcriptional regulator [Oscillospiraceae bacterium]
MDYEKGSTASLIDTIYQTLLARILSGELQPGDWLPAERELAEQMSVSRSSLHNALTQLESEGFVSVEPRRGTIVTDYRKHPTPQSLSAVMNYSSFQIDEPLFRDLMALRLLVETECTRLACTNFYDTTLAEMREIADLLEAEDADLAELIYRYHYLLTQASGNSVYSMIFRGFETVIKVLVDRHYSLQAVDIREAAAMHRELADHIERRDEAAAADCIRRILLQGVSVLEGFYHTEE